MAAPRLLIDDRVSTKRCDQCKRFLVKSHYERGYCNACWEKKADEVLLGRKLLRPPRYVPQFGHKFRIHTLNIAGDYTVDELVLGGNKELVGIHATKIEDPELVEALGPARAWITAQDFAKYGIYPIPETVNMKENNMPNLADLTHATLVAHTEQLQADYDALVAENEALSGNEEEIRSLERSIEELEVEAEDLRGQLYESEQQRKDQEKLKNKHIDLHADASRRANTAEQDVKMLRQSVAEISGHLKDTLEEGDLIQVKLNHTAELCGSLRSEVQKLRLESQPQIIEQNSKERISLASLKYSAIQTVVRFGLTAATASWITYLLA